MQTDGVCVRIGPLRRIVQCRRWALLGAFVLAIVVAASLALPAAAISSGENQMRPKVRFRPRIVGEPRVGVALRATRGDWTSPRPTVYQYRWLRCRAGPTKCRRIAGAARSRYIPSSRDVGTTLRVTVTARNIAGSARATSRQTRAVSARVAQADPPAVTSSPTVSGTAREGQTLTAATGTWSGTQPIGYAYQWQSCDSSGNSCIAISGATTTTYTPSSSDVGGTLKVTVTASNMAGSATASSAATAVVQPPPAPPPSLVALWHMDETSGTTMVDSAGANNGTLSNVQTGLPGFLGTAYGFDGSSSYVSVPSAAVLNPGAANITIAIHINTTGTPPPSPDDWDLIRKGYYSSSGGEYSVELQHSGQASCTFKGSVGYIEQFTAGPALNDGQWHTIQCSKTATAVELVVDGQVYSTSISIGTIANSDPLVIGGRPGSDWFQGQLDEASIQTG
jgi:Concanavalin A-like lectin/glucanases superfamily